MTSKHAAINFMFGHTKQQSSLSHNCPLVPLMVQLELDVSVKQSNILQVRRYQDLKAIGHVHAVLNDIFLQ
jgi:hypothetical protein